MTKSAHRICLLKWLNAWGCRHLSKDQHKVASISILDWYNEDRASLFPREKPIWYLTDNELEKAAYLYGSLKEKTGARPLLDGKETIVRIGETAASKILFSIRPEAIMPWDRAMKDSFSCDGSPESYFRYLKTIRKLANHIKVLCERNNFQIGELPNKLGRPNSTVLALINEYIWVTETRKCEIPPSEVLAQWVELG